ncbi:OLC1v1008960C2 [Oldenlandia corymbosa var. corymbosa]|uniref:OLC1v1008960C2 n=1 Tax=Oldenlandia corymbosa var. corymbosa TaxID=529605 RepID=A0AAV1DMU6_OLDCO|nr:OLC1v1008960C2 [Oldenlandia corymbosa var. corymbosa]
MDLTDSRSWSSLLLLAIIASSHFNVVLAEARGKDIGRNSAGNSPYTAKASLIRYWRNKVSSTSLPNPSFLNKASPLDAIQMAKFSEFADDQQLMSDQFSNFCKAAYLFCFHDEGTSLTNDSKEYSESAAGRFPDYRNLFRHYGPSAKEWVEPGTFFREKMLETGAVMPMPDIKDKMPKRSFLPPKILSKIPFSTTKIHELKKIFHSSPNNDDSRIFDDALSECERAPSAGETKWCSGSGEDMIDFATSLLGKNIAVRSIEGTRGSGENIMIGSVTRINDGRITKSVSCHQLLYPYLLYYCHSVPMVRVYEADILDPKSKSKINHGVAICHIDTSTWSQDHEAFVALGSGPGKIEVCHWIFENDFIWTISD